MVVERALLGLPGAGVGRRGGRIVDARDVDLAVRIGARIAAAGADRVVLDLVALVVLIGRDAAGGIRRAPRSAVGATGCLVVRRDGLGADRPHRDRAGDADEAGAEPDGERLDLLVRERVDIDVAVGIDRRAGAEVGLGGLVDDADVDAAADADDATGGTTGDRQRLHEVDRGHVDALGGTRAALRVDLRARPDERLRVDMGDRDVDGAGEPTTPPPIDAARPKMLSPELRLDGDALEVAERAEARRDAGAVAVGAAVAGGTRDRRRGVGATVDVARSADERLRVLGDREDANARGHAYESRPRCRRRRSRSSGRWPRAGHCRRRRSSRSFPCRRRSAVQDSHAPRPRRRPCRRRHPPRPTRSSRCCRPSPTRCRARNDRLVDRVAVDEAWSRA